MVQPTATRFNSMMLKPGMELPPGASFDPNPQGKMLEQQGDEIFLSPEQIPLAEEPAPREE